MNSYFYRCNFRYIATRYEEWQAGHRISSGPISTEIVAKTSGDKIYFTLDEVNGIRLAKSFVFDAMGESSCVLPDRIQYSHQTDFNPVIPVVCHIFYTGTNMDYIRFAMTNPDRIVEFYGKLIECEKSSQNDGNGIQAPTMQQISSLIGAISKIQLAFSDIAKQTGSSINKYKIFQFLEAFKMPLYYAWQGYKFGWHTDFCEEGDSLEPFMMFELNMKGITQKLVDILRNQSPFTMFEENSAITGSLIAVYTAFLNDLNCGKFKF